MTGFLNIKRDGVRVKAAVLALLVAGFRWMGTAANANAMDLTYAAYKVDGFGSSAVQPGEMIGSGEKLLIKIKYLNDDPMPTSSGAIVFTLPRGCVFVKAEQSKFVEVSVDGGHVFGPLDHLAVREGGSVRPATGADVTHIRLALIHSIASGEGGEVAVIAESE